MKPSKLLAVASLAIAAFAVSTSTASAAHYCVETPAGVKQTNGNGNRGGEGWRNSTPGLDRASVSNDRLFDCGMQIPPPARVNGR